MSVKNDSLSRQIIWTLSNIEYELCTRVCVITYKHEENYYPLKKSTIDEKNK